MKYRILLFLTIGSALLTSCATDSKQKHAQKYEEKFINTRFDEKEVSQRQLFDMNKDHTVDLWKFYKNKQASDEERGTLVLMRKEVDANFDGRVDSILFYNDKEELIAEEGDKNFDGFVDYKRYYDAKVLTKIEYFDTETTRYVIDIEGSEPGFPNRTRYYRKGVLSREEIDSNVDGKFDSVTLFDADGNIMQQGDDKNGDGLVDDWKRYN